MKVRYRLEGARRAICRHSAHNVPSMPVGHVKTAPSITLHTGQGERDREKEEVGDGWGETETNMGRESCVDTNNMIEVMSQKGKEYSHSLFVGLCVVGPVCCDHW